MKTLTGYFLVVFFQFWLVFSDENLIFRDDFNGDGLDLSKWNPTNKRSEVNGELEFYTPDAVSVRKGSLLITTNPSKNYSGFYTSGRVDTQKKFVFTYGKIEWRAKVPRGKGIWSALWLSHHLCPAAVNCDGYWPPAIDVIDFRGDIPTEVVGTTHFLGDDKQYQSLHKVYQSPVDLSLDFHVYALVWKRDSLQWFVDGELYFSASMKNSVPDVQMQLVMNVAVGGPFPGLPDETTTFPTEFMIDYVSVTQNADELGTISGKGKMPPYVAILVGVILPATLIASAVLGALLWKRRQAVRGDMRKRSTATLGSNGTVSTSAYNAYFIPDNMKEELAIQHYVNLLEIPTANLQISDNVLGKGEYGIVRKGVARGLRGQPRPTVVAVKSVKNPSDEDQHRQLIDEMKIMTKAGRHLNIVNLLGAVVKGETVLLLEFCPFGSLLKYLKTHRGAYFQVALDSDANLVPISDKDRDAQQDHLDIFKPRRSFPEENFDNQVLTTCDLVNFAFQISRGMEHLAGRSIIHRDLAARNILVSENRVIKIADFGMARQESEYIVSHQQVALPVKWMSPEAITRRVFCQKSDVWSFGVLLWEMFALGETPYNNSGLSSYVYDFVTSIAEGYRMERPASCPNQMYEIMQQTWELDPQKRPTFAELEDQLRRLLTIDSVDAYLVMDMPYQQFNLAHQDLLDEICDPPYRESGAI